MKILIIYASIEGQTRKIAGEIARTVEKAGHIPAIMNVGNAQEFGLERPDAVILAAPIHSGHYPSPFVNFVHRESEWLNNIPSAFVSVTLSIRSEHEDERKEAIGFPDMLKKLTGWKPHAVLNAAGALRFTEYDFFKRWVLRRIAEAEGARPDGHDMEFTDWAELAVFVEKFLEDAGKDD